MAKEYASLHVAEHHEAVSQQPVTAQASSPPFRAVPMHLSPRSNWEKAADRLISSVALEETEPLPLRPQPTGRFREHQPTIPADLLDSDGEDLDAEADAMLAQLLAGDDS